MVSMESMLFASSLDTVTTVGSGLTSSPSLSSASSGTEVSWASGGMGEFEVAIAIVEQVRS